MTIIITVLTLLIIATIIWWHRKMAAKNTRQRQERLPNVEADPADTKTDEFADLFSAIEEKFNDENSETIVTTGEFRRQQPTEIDPIACHHGTLDKTKIIDTDRLITLFEDKDMVNELIDDFINGHQQDLTLLEQSIKQGNRKETSSIAHRMKGAARTLECHQLADPLAQIEIAKKEEKLTSDTDSINTIKALTQQMLTEYHHEHP